MRLQLFAIIAAVILLATGCKKGSDTAILVHVQSSTGAALSDKSISLLSDDNRVYWNDPKAAKKATTMETSVLMQRRGKATIYTIMPMTVN
jgi:uncharacterized protein YcfL